MLDSNGPVVTRIMSFFRGKSPRCPKLKKVHNAVSTIKQDQRKELSGLCSVNTTLSLPDVTTTPEEQTQGMCAHANTTSKQEVPCPSEISPCGKTSTESVPEIFIGKAQLSMCSDNSGGSSWSTESLTEAITRLRGSFFQRLVPTIMRLPPLKAVSETSSGGSNGSAKGTSSDGCGIQSVQYCGVQYVSSSGVPSQDTDGSGECLKSKSESALFDDGPVAVGGDCKDGGLSRPPLEAARSHSVRSRARRRSHAKVCRKKSSMTFKQEAGESSAGADVNSITGDAFTDDQKPSDPSLPGYARCNKPSCGSRVMSSISSVVEVDSECSLESNLSAVSASDSPSSVAEPADSGMNRVLQRFAQRLTPPWSTGSGWHQKKSLGGTSSGSTYLDSGTGTVKDDLSCWEYPEAEAVGSPLSFCRIGSPTKSTVSSLPVSLVPVPAAAPMRPRLATPDSLQLNLSTAFSTESPELSSPVLAYRKYLLEHKDPDTRLDFAEFLAKRTVEINGSWQQNRRRLRPLACVRGKPFSSSSSSSSSSNESISSHRPAATRAHSRHRRKVYRHSSSFPQTPQPCSSSKCQVQRVGAGQGTLHSMSMQCVPRDNYDHNAMTTGPAPPSPLCLLRRTLPQSVHDGPALSLPQTSRHPVGIPPETVERKSRSSPLFNVREKGLLQAQGSLDYSIKGELTDNACYIPVCRMDLGDSITCSCVAPMSTLSRTPSFFGTVHELEDRSGGATYYLPLTPADGQPPPMADSDCSALGSASMSPALFPSSPADWERRTVTSLIPYQFGSLP